MFQGRISGTPGKGPEHWAWLHELDSYFQSIEFKQGVKLTDPEKIAFAVTFFRGGAQAWFVGMDRQAKRPRTWTAFKRAVAGRFRNHTPALVRMKKLEQTGSVEGYVCKFEALVAETGPYVKEQDLYHAFLHGLKPDVCTKVYFALGGGDKSEFHCSEPGMLDRAVAEALRIDYEAGLEGEYPTRADKRYINRRKHG